MKQEQYYNVKYSYLKTVFDKICQNNTISTEMRALIMDEMEKKREEEISESDNMYDSVNLRSPSPDVDEVSDSPYTSSKLQTDGQPKVGRGLPSNDDI